MLGELNDIAGQHETVGEKLTSVVVTTLQSSIQDMKQERKKVWHTDVCIICKWREFYAVYFTVECIQLYYVIPASFMHLRS